MLSRVVLTNGCFDILHLGHLRYLEMSKELGDRLVVAVNDDASVKRLKGASRPIQDEKTRLALVSALRVVDEAFLFSEMMEVLEAWRPLVYTKGGDYSIDTINQEERHFVESYGGSIKILLTGITESTTGIYERCCNNSYR